MTGSTVDAQENQLIVEVQNINTSHGVIYVALYDSEENYLKNHSFSLSTDASPGSVQLMFNNLPFGVYAVSAIHDVNANKELDKNFLGIPVEGFGFRNGEMGIFGPPAFEKVKVNWGGGNEKVEVPLKYY